MPELFLDKSVQLAKARLQPVSTKDAKALGDAIATLLPWSTYSYSAASLTSYLTRTDPALHRYGIFVDDKIAGAVAIRSPWLRGPYLELLAVLPDFQRRGIGANILEWMEQQTLGHHRNLWVVTSAFNTDALNFYTTSGFKITGSLPGLVREEYEEILLRKQL